MNCQLDCLFVWKHALNIVALAVPIDIPHFMNLAK